LREREKSASCWSLLHKYIMRHGPQNVKFQGTYNLQQCSQNTGYHVRCYMVSQTETWLMPNFGDF